LVDNTAGFFTILPKTQILMVKVGLFRGAFFGMQQKQREITSDRITKRAMTPLNAPPFLVAAVH
jgi:hypothetical protein